MDDVITQYQRWKEQGEALRTKARQAIEARFRDLLAEAVRLAEEYRADFGATLKPPPSITAFRYKTATRRPRKPESAAPAKLPSKGAPAAATPNPPQPDPKIAALEKRLAAARKKLAAAQAKGIPTRNLEDRVYEIEDDLRIAQNPD